ncbi:tripartite tricarboxylate transporter TctB family protein [Roseovarius dicentrarchi]|uniref:tripartite tricarboxylate transporter TctB family protein n=1 Tax=Roseovarius dicentrarchi TaxID=2250573 RepID=UPI000DEA9088|nr:tripartite tricarboxylate transporter TctB family protein [Roseovarius dicentrarchi]
MHDPFPSRRTRRPGEAVFAVLMAALSAVLLVNAYGISGLGALSAPGSVPMAAAAVMLGAAFVIAWRTMRRPRAEGQTLHRDVLPGRILAITALLIAYAALLEPLGFLPTSALFLILSIRLLSRRGWGFASLVSVGSLVAIWLIFRIVFTVLMPSGLVPEAELIQALRDLTGAR